VFHRTVHHEGAIAHILCCDTTSEAVIIDPPAGAVGMIRSECAEAGLFPRWVIYTGRTGHPVASPAELGISSISPVATGDRAIRVQVAGIPLIIDVAENPGVDSFRVGNQPRMPIRQVYDSVLLKVGGLELLGLPTEDGLLWRVRNYLFVGSALHAGAVEFPEHTFPAWMWKLDADTLIMSSRRDTGVCVSTVRQEQEWSQMLEDTGSWKALA
jgi:hypothetical protein